ncbi:MAG TPA: hypothetical protein VM659_28850 [Dongiaceae bacterium]|nr:hypothetical protein [Dongiaceae bacterium]
MTIAGDELNIWRDEPDSDCGWSDPETERWYGIGERGRRSWPVPEAVAVKLMQMGAAAQREAKTPYIDHGDVVVEFDDIDAIAVLKQATEQ